MSSANTRSAKILTPDFHPGPTVLPPGEYELGFSHYKLVSRFQRGVLEVWLSVTEYGPNFGLLIPRYYNVQLSAGKRNFRSKPQSAFSKEYCRLFGRRPHPMGTAALAVFREVLVVGAVETVETDYEQKRIPTAAQYSVIRELVRAV